jgi:hypothetical protein
MPQSFGISRLRVEKDRSRVPLGRTYTWLQLGEILRARGGRCPLRVRKGAVKDPDVCGSNFP